MDAVELEARIALGEDVSTEFKRCGSQPGSDTFETVCSFANRQGGDIFLGVLDDGTVEGIVPTQASAIERNIANVVSNPALFNEAPLVEFERIALDGKVVLRVWVPMGPAVYRYKGVVYDRIADADVKVRSEARIPDMYIRKQGVYTERTVYPYLRQDDLRADVIDRARQMAVARRSDHPWRALDDEGLLRSAGLYVRDFTSGREGLCLAAALLFGTDDTIRSVLPAYETDAIVRLVDGDRYDDREVVRTNLLDSYDALYAFCRRNLPDPFMLDGAQSVSVRDVVVRELVSNLLAHREYASQMPARIVIRPDGIRTENASRSRFEGRLTPDGFSPMPKNPLIADVFLQIGLVEKLGSGVRNLFRVSRERLGADPILEDGDVFRSFVPLARPVAVRPEVRTDAESRGEGHCDGVSSASEMDMKLKSLLDKYGAVTTAELAQELGVSERTARSRLSELVQAGALQAVGETNRRRYVLADQEGK